MQFLVYILVALGAVGLTSLWFVAHDTKIEQRVVQSQDQNTLNTDSETITQKEEVAVPEQPQKANTHTLSLAHAGLTKVPTYVFSRTDIEVLDVSNNDLSGALQAEVRQLTNLKVLDLSDNQFTGVPAEIGQLQNLEVLDLSNNKLTGLPYELGNLSHLKTLNLSGNAYATADLEIIKKSLPSTAVIITK